MAIIANSRKLAVYFLMLITIIVINFIITIITIKMKAKITFTVIIIKFGLKIMIADWLN
jgi:hypothetical protein